jgi:hypothetical protein
MFISHVEKARLICTFTHDPERYPYSDYLAVGHYNIAFDWTGSLLLAQAQRTWGAAA